MIEALIDEGADVNYCTEEGKTPLMMAARFNKNPAVIEALIKAGADIKAEDDKGMTAFKYGGKNSKIRGTPAYWKLNDLN